MCSLLNCHFSLLNSPNKVITDHTCQLPQFNYKFSIYIWQTPLCKPLKRYDNMSTCISQYYATIYALSHECSVLCSTRLVHLLCFNPLALGHSIFFNISFHDSYFWSFNFSVKIVLIMFFTPYS